MTRTLSISLTVALHDTYHRLAVIGLLYELGECNRSLDHFWSEFPEMKTGISFPLEAYFVHQLDDVALHGTYHRLAVIGLFYELGECNRSLDNFWSEFPEMKARISIPGSHLERIWPFMARTTALL